MKINLVIDLGNSRVKLGLFSDTVEIKYFDSVEAVLEVLPRLNYHRAIVSSVLKEEVSVKLLGKLHDALLFTNELPLPISNFYATPKTLGLDRLAGIVAAADQFPGQHVLVIDAGTCLKIDFFTPEKGYMGGSISPGLEMRYKALHTFTAKLPLVNDVKEFQLIGNSTVTSIQSGVLGGMFAEISGKIIQFEQQYGPLKVIFTGGDGLYFSNLELSQKSSIFADDLLTLKGLNVILNYNAKN